MGTVACSMCKCEVTMVDGPTMCTSCGFTILPEEAAAPVEAEPVAPQSSDPRDLAAWSGLAKHRPATEGQQPLADSISAMPARPFAPVEPVEPAPAPPPAEPIEAPAPRPATRSITRTFQKPKAAPAAEPAAAPADGAEAPAGAARPVLPPEAQVRTIVGQSVQTTSVWHSFQTLGRDGLQCAAVGGIYALVALTFLAIVFRPFSPKAWAATVFVELQLFSALAFAAARYLNRHGRHDDVEQMLHWLAAPLLPFLALSAGMVTLHLPIAGAVATALVVANGVLLHRRLVPTLPSGPARALEFIGTGLLAAAGLAPLLGAFPPLGACAVAALLWQGQVLLTRRTETERPQPYPVLKVSLLLLGSALFATVGLTRGAWQHGGGALPVWGMFLTSMVLIVRNYCRTDPSALPAEYAPLLEPSVGAGLVAGFAMTLGDPVGMAVTGAIAGAATLRESIRRGRALLILPAIAISLGIYAWLPDPRSMGLTSLRSVVPPLIERFAGASHWTALAIFFAPWAIALAAAAALLARRGHHAHARVVGTCALPAALATCAGMLLGATSHWMVGTSLATASAALLVCGLLARQAIAVLPAALGLLLGVGAAAFSLKLPYAQIELALTLTMLATLLSLGAVQRHASDFVLGFTRRWVDFATLFVMTAIPVAASAYQFTLPSEMTTVSNEVAIGLLAFFVAHAWHRPEAALVASGLFGRACLGLLAFRFPGWSAVEAVQFVGAASALPVVLWCLTPLFPLDRRVIPVAPPGALATLFSVWTVQAFAGWKYWRGLIGIEKDVRTLVITAAFVVVPWIAAIVVGLCVRPPRRRAPTPTATAAATAAAE
jgi:hypothetical protein